MLARCLPLPSYLRSDRVEMVPPDLLALAHRAGGVHRLRRWFAGHWPAYEEAEAEWDAYLSGRYVCLRTVTPHTIQRKTALVEGIETALRDPRPRSAEWLDRLHALVDELDALSPPFTAYDRLRFGGPVSRDRCVDAVRVAHPRR